MATLPGRMETEVAKLQEVSLATDVAILPGSGRMATEVANLQGVSLATEVAKL